MIKGPFLQHLQDLYTVPVISDQFKLLVWTWAGSMDWLIQSKSVTLSPLIICCSYSGFLSSKINKFELFHHVKNLTATQSSELAIFCELYKNFKKINFYGFILTREIHESINPRK